MNCESKSWKRQTLLFFVSQCITLLGSQIVQMAILWHVTLHTASGTWIAAFSLCSYLPQFFVSFPGGVWADRHHKKQLIIAADALIAAVTLGMMLLMPRITSEAILLTALLLMSVIRSAGAGIQTPAVSASIAQLVPKEHLMHYNGVNAAMQSVVQFAAPAASAVLLTAHSLRAVLMVDILTALLGIGLLFCIPLPNQKSAHDSPSARSDMAQGIRYAISHSAVRNTLSIYGLFLFLTVPAGYLSGLLVSRMYGDTYWHLTAVEVVGFGGMLLGGLLMSLWGGFKRRRLTLSVGLAFFGAMAIAMGASLHFAAYLVFMALYGIALTTVQTTITTIIQENTDASMHGRVFGLMSALYASCYPLGMALFGPMADRIPLPGLMLFSGAALILLAAAAYCDRSV